MKDFQSVAAIAIVLITIVVMAYFNFKKKGSCAGGCSCAPTKTSKIKKA